MSQFWRTSEKIKPAPFHILQIRQIKHSIIHEYSIEAVSKCIWKHLAIKLENKGS